MSGEWQRHEFFFSRASLGLGRSADDRRVSPVDPPMHGPDSRRAARAGAAGRQAESLAAACDLAPRRRVSSPLLTRFMENRRVLLRARRRDPGRWPPGGPRHRRRLAGRQLPHHRRRAARGASGPAARLRRGPAETGSRRRWPATPASTPWPWRWSPTPTASSTSRGSPGSSRRSRRSPP